jgi:hypothetical protein
MKVWKDSTKMDNFASFCLLLERGTQYFLNWNIRHSRGIFAMFAYIYLVEQFHSTVNKDKGVLNMAKICKMKQADEDTIVSFFLGK